MTVSPRREMVLQEIDATGNGFLAALAGLGEAEAAVKPAEGKWSVAETAEHTTVVLQSITKLVTKKLLGLPLPPRESSPRITDDQIVRLMFDRSRVRPAPEAVNPTGRYGSLAATIAVFTTTRAELEAWIRATDADLREYGSPHPILGTLDGVQWLLFAAAHTERHTRQILEVREAVAAR